MIFSAILLYRKFSHSPFSVKKVIDVIAMINKYCDPDNISLNALQPALELTDAYSLRLVIAIIVVARLK